VSGPWVTTKYYTSIRSEAEIICFLPYFRLKFSTRAHTTRGPIVGEFFSCASHSLFRPSTFSPVTRVCRKIEKNSDRTPFLYCVRLTVRLTWKNCRTTRRRDYIIIIFSWWRIVMNAILLWWVAFFAPWNILANYRIPALTADNITAVGLLSALDPMRNITI